MCDGISAGDRARWCVTELNLTAQLARQIQSREPSKGSVEGSVMICDDM